MPRCANSMALCRVPVCTPAYPRNVTASAYETVLPRAVVPGLIKWNAYLWSHWLGLARLGLARLGFGGCRGVHVAGFARGEKEREKRQKALQEKWFSNSSSISSTKFIGPRIQKLVNYILLGGGGGGGGGGGSGRVRDPREHRGRTEQRPEYIGRRMDAIEEAEKKRGAEKREAFTRGKRTCHKLRACKSEARPRIPQIRVSNTRLAQAASGCAPSVDVLPIFDVKQQSGGTPLGMGGPALVGFSLQQHKRLGFCTCSGAEQPTSRRTLRLGYPRIRYPAEKFQMPWHSPT
ncbi:hypothetical protein WN51_13305 [Melipona quadrifasciata]|uniref:Uncharacterized protein n=1 Tax=Melipona quadrifasciata TaxID=166423 RepID=A0A0N0BGZ0_9HYME|nr:hypothetical protein WN51_13305 [Melipona quadrifasciata]